MLSKIFPSVGRLPAMAHSAISYSQALSGRQKTSPTATPAQPQPTSIVVSEGSIRAYTKANPLDRNRKADHRPRTSHDEANVYVLTLNTTPSLSNPLTALRDKHFPVHLNHTPAHLTMFHALPGSERDGIVAVLEELCRNIWPFKVTTGAPFRLKRGVGISVAQGLEDAQRVHRELQQRWSGILSAQDSQSWRPHWTIQNKVDEEVVAAKTMDEVQTEFQGAEGTADGVVLFLYDKGRWRYESHFEFGRSK